MAIDPRIVPGFAELPIEDQKAAYILSGYLECQKKAILRGPRPDEDVNEILASQLMALFDEHCVDMMPSQVRKVWLIFKAEHLKVMALIKTGLKGHSHDN
jgi:hypothetical protein